MNQSVDQLNLHKQVKQYQHNLEEIMSRLLPLTRTPSALPVMTLMARLELELGKYRQAQTKLSHKVQTKGAIRTMRGYLRQSYDKLVKQSHQLMNLSMGHTGLPLAENISKLKQIETEMEDQWLTLPPKPRQPPADSADLQIMASRQIQNQFLQMRKLAYNMYQDYSSHAHVQVLEELRVLAEEQGKLLQQMGEMRGLRRDLLEEERLMREDLAELKKVNELLGRRYFFME